MSLGTTERMYAGHEQADAALLVADGITYRCYVWLSRVEWRVEAACFRVQANGTEVEVFRNVVARASAQEIGDTNGVPLDCPRILASGTTFIVHWLQSTDVISSPVIARDWALYRATMDMEAFSATSWDSRGAVALLETHLLYDAQPIIGHADAFVVARLTDTNVIEVQRWNEADGYDWVDQVWTASAPALDAAPHVLGVYAHLTDDDVIVTFQRDTTGSLYSSRISASAGGGPQGPTVTFNVFDDAVSESNTEWVQVGHCRTAADRVAVVAEARAAINENGSSGLIPLGWVHHVVYRHINSATVERVGNEHWCANLSMHSRPWSYASGTSTTSPRLDVYVMLTFRSIIYSKEWSQAAAFACNLDFSQWQAVDSGAGLRPRPIGTITGNSIGIPDCRTSGWHPEEGDVHTGGPTKRINHLASASSAVPGGTDIKTRTIPLVFFNAIRSTSNLDDTDLDDDFDDIVANTNPEGAGVHGVVVYMEDPWTIFRDVTDPAQPVDNFAFPFARAMHQCVPWGRGMFVAGGTPQLYDGSQMVEAGFLWKPDVLGFSVGTNGTMEPGPGYRSYYFVYSWIDKLGTEHRSGPSEVVLVPFTMSDTSVRFGVRCMTVSLKDADAFYPLAESINIEVFRTELNGSAFYRVYGATEVGPTFNQRPRDTPVNDPEVLLGYVDIDDGDVTDVMLIEQGSAPYLFDTSGVFIEPLPQTWPACHAVALHQNRIVAADSLSPTRFVYSDENQPVGAATNAAPILGSGQQFYTGEIQDTTGFQSEGNILYQFTREKIYALSASDAGFGLLSWTSQIVHDALGCVDPKSLVLFPLGIGFQSLKGYYTLARSGEASYGVLARSRDQPGSLGGAAIEDDILEAGNIRAASHNPTKHRIDLVCNGRPTVTQTWTFTLGVAGSTAGVWSITGLAVPISISIIGIATAVNTIADTLAAAVTTALAVAFPNPLTYQVASVTSPTNTVVLTLVGDVDLTLAGVAPGTNTNVATAVEVVTTNPWRLSYHYDVEQWSKAELVQTNAITRLAELVDGCYWMAQGGARHVALAQGGVLLERLPTDALAYADQTSSGNVGIPIDLQTAWLHFGGIAGYVRVKEIGVVTERDEDGALHVDVEYDRSGALDSLEIEPSTYDWTSPAPAYLRVRQREQKVSSVRLRIYEDSGVTTAGNTCSIVALVFEVGLKPGMRRVRDAQIGST